MTFLLKYWKPLAALAVLALVFASGFASGNRLARNECIRKEARATKRALKDIEQANARANAADAKLQKVLDQPKAGTKIREVLREVEIPSDCVVPTAVDDGVRDAIARANATAR